MNGQTQLSLLLTIENKYRKRYASVLRGYYMQFADLYPYYPVIDPKELETLLFNHAMATAKVFYSMTSRETKGFSDWLARKAVELARRAKAVAISIVDGIRQKLVGKDPATITTVMERDLPAKTERITVTETHTAAMDASVAAAKENQNMFKVWTPTMDEVTRKDHWNADGQKVPIDGFFTIGGVSMFAPGDPSAPPEQTVNCRCVLTYSK